MLRPITFARLTLCLALPSLGGCAGWFETQTPSLSDGKAVSELLKPVPVYDKAPCWMQKEWSADNTRKEAAAGGKKVFAPPCVFDKKEPKKVPASPPEQKTS
jgi:hypothetical protein